MPTATEFRSYEARARKDSDDYLWWATQHPDRADYYRQWSDNCLYHAEQYRLDAERLERLERVEWKA